MSEESFPLPSTTICSFRFRPHWNGRLLNVGDGGKDEDAAGGRIKELPITPEKVLKALHQKELEKEREVAISQTS